MAGQNLIKAAELRKVSAEHSQLLTAINTFRHKYHALPGDMRNATKFWGVARSDCMTWTGTGPIDPDGRHRTCNGNGDNNLLIPPRRPAPEGVTSAETVLFWHHLYHAGLIPAFEDGMQYFKSAYPNGYWGASNSSWGIGKNMLGIVGNNTSASDPEEQVSLFLPEDAWGIDTKLDDGKPFTGAVKTYPGSSGNATLLPNCTEMPDGSNTNANGIHKLGAGHYVVLSPDGLEDARYKLSVSKQACLLLFDF